MYVTYDAKYTDVTEWNEKKITDKAVHWTLSNFCDNNFSLSLSFLLSSSTSRDENELIKFTHNYFIFLITSKKST